MLAAPVTGYTGASESFLWQVGQALRLRTLKTLTHRAWRPRYYRIVKSFLLNKKSRLVQRLTRVTNLEADNDMSPTVIRQLVKFVPRERGLFIAFG